MIYNFIHSKDAEARGEIEDGINTIEQSMIKVHVAKIIFFVKTNFVVIIDCKSTNISRVFEFSQINT